MLFSGTFGVDRASEPAESPSITIGADFSRKGSKHRIYINPSMTITTLAERAAY